MEWQWGLMLAFVTVAAAYIARATWRTWRAKPGGCGGGCGCKSAEPQGAESFVNSEQIRVLRR